MDDASSLTPVSSEGLSHGLAKEDATSWAHRTQANGTTHQSELDDRLWHAVAAYHTLPTHPLTKSSSQEIEASSSWLSGEQGTIPSQAIDLFPLRGESVHIGPTGDEIPVELESVDMDWLISSAELGSPLSEQALLSHASTMPSPSLSQQVSGSQSVSNASLEGVVGSDALLKAGHRRSVDLLHIRQAYSSSSRSRSRIAGTIFRADPVTKPSHRRRSSHLSQRTGEMGSGSGPSTSVGPSSTVSRGAIQPLPALQEVQTPKSTAIDWSQAEFEDVSADIVAHFNSLELQLEPTLSLSPQQTRETSEHAPATDPDRPGSAFDESIGPWSSSAYGSRLPDDSLLSAHATSSVGRSSPFSSLSLSFEDSLFPHSNESTSFGSAGQYSIEAIANRKASPGCQSGQPPVSTSWLPQTDSQSNSPQIHSSRSAGELGRHISRQAAVPRIIRADLQSSALGARSISMDALPSQSALSRSWSSPIAIHDKRPRQRVDYSEVSAALETVRAYLRQREMAADKTAGVLKTGPQTSSDRTLRRTDGNLPPRGSVKLDTSSSSRRDDDLETYQDRQQTHHHHKSFIPSSDVAQRERERLDVIEHLSGRLQHLRQQSLQHSEPEGNLPPRSHAPEDHRS